MLLKIAYAGEQTVRDLSPRAEPPPELPVLPIQRLEALSHPGRVLLPRGHALEERFDLVASGPGPTKLALELLDPGQGPGDGLGQYREAVVGLTSLGRGHRVPPQDGR